MKTKLRVVDLFCGCGGASIGVVNSDHSVVAAVDANPIACSVYSQHIGIEPMCSDLTEINGQTLLDHYGLRKDEIDIVVGCPPCQGFSSLKNTTNKDGNDERNGLIDIFLKRVGELEPAGIIFENVSGIQSRANRHHLNRLVENVQTMGYSINKNLLVDAADYGVPQHRKRIVVTGVKESKEAPALPPQQYFDPSKRTTEQMPWKTVRSAIGDLPVLENGEIHATVPNHEARLHSARVLTMIRSIPKDGGGRKSLPENLWLPCHKRISRGAETVYGRLRWDQPSTTITSRCTTPSCGRFLHPDQDRAITIREAARLQTFPDDFVFPNNREESQRLVGNAVPPKLIEELLEGFREYL
ncbi:MAG: DNA cytosine methyltransferase [Halobacteriota archaeon]